MTPRNRERLWLVSPGAPPCAYIDALPGRHLDLGIVSGTERPLATCPGLASTKEALDGYRGPGMAVLELADGGGFVPVTRVPWQAAVSRLQQDGNSVTVVGV
jgi:hypothetical protein